MEAPSRVEDYRLGPSLGQGLTGERFLATGPGDRQVVLKLCHPERAELTPTSVRMLRELDPRVDRYEALGERGEGWSGWLVSWRLQAVSYLDLLEEESLEARVRLLQRAAEAVAVMHAAGVTHGTLKPSNVLVRRERNGTLLPVITDVGVVPSYAAEFHDQPAQAIRLYPYLAPEAILAFRGGAPLPLEAPQDVYALGALLCALLTGQGPGTAEGERLPAEILASKERRRYCLSALLEPESSLDLGVLDRLLGRALARDPAKRPTAILFADAVAASLSNHPWEAETASARSPS